jgi:hypothetical protein
MRDTIRFLTEYIGRNSGDPHETFLLALALGRFGIVTDRSAVAISSYLATQVRAGDLRREAVMHLGRARTPPAERALLDLFVTASRAEPRDDGLATDAFVALIANGRRTTWTKMRKVGAPDAAELATLNTLLAR